MSLINDALRKARQAASEHEAQSPETAFRPPVAYPSRGRGRRSGALGLVVVAIAAGLAGAVTVWWILGRSSPGIEPGTSQIETAAVPAGSVDAVREHTSDGTPVETAAGPKTQVGEARPSELPPEAQSKSPADGVELNPAPEAHPTPAKSAMMRDAEGRRVFVLDADLGYAKLSLGYIVARSTNPFAEINGDDLYVGSEVEGFEVITIEADRVVLKDARGELVLRVP